jgi:hypothetical protein
LPGNAFFTCDTLTGTANTDPFEVTFTFPELIITLLEPGEVMTMVRHAGIGSPRISTQLLIEVDISNELDLYLESSSNRSGVLECNSFVPTLRLPTFRDADLQRLTVEPTASATATATISTTFTSTEVVVASSTSLALASTSLTLSSTTSASAGSSEVTLSSGVYLLSLPLFLVS